ncbi:MAG: hypothetical protein HC822_01615 [Oscillochloris sp.]|nr:hypothetical protein [Oscillochloris sp.]
MPPGLSRKQYGNHLLGSLQQRIHGVFVGQDIKRRAQTARRKRGMHQNIRIVTIAAPININLQRITIRMEIALPFERTPVTP